MYGAWDALKNVDKVLPNHRSTGPPTSSANASRAGCWATWCSPWTISYSGPAVPRRLRAHRLEQSICTCPIRATRRASRATPSSPTRRISATQCQQPVLDSLPLPLLAQHRQPLHGRARHQRHARGAGRGARDAHRRLHGRDRRHGRQPVRQHDTSPRGIYEKHLAELQDLMRRGVGKEPGANTSYENQGEPAPKRTATPKN